MTKYRFGAALLVLVALGCADESAPANTEPNPLPTMPTSAPSNDIQKQPEVNWGGNYQRDEADRKMGRVEAGAAGQPHRYTARIKISPEGIEADATPGDRLEFGDGVAGTFKMVQPGSYLAPGKRVACNARIFGTLPFDAAAVDVSLEVSGEGCDPEWMGHQSQLQFDFQNVEGSFRGRRTQFERFRLFIRETMLNPCGVGDTLDARAAHCQERNGSLAIRTLKQGKWTLLRFNGSATDWRDEQTGLAWIPVDHAALFRDAQAQCTQTPFLRLPTREDARLAAEHGYWSLQTQLFSDGRSWTSTEESSGARYVMDADSPDSHLEVLIGIAGVRCIAQ